MLSNQCAAIKKLLTRLTSNMSLIFRVLRFAWVGVVSSLAYVLVVGFYVEIAEFGAKWASVFSYITVLPISFFGHRKVTFRSTNNAPIEAIKFLSIHALNIGVSVAGMYGAVDWLGYSHWLGSFSAVVLVPLSTFLLMDRWVFARKKGS